MAQRADNVSGTRGRAKPRPTTLKRVLTPLLAFIVVPTIVALLSIMAMAIVAYLYFILTPDNLQSVAGQTRAAEGLIPRIALSVLLILSATLITHLGTNGSLFVGPAMGILTGIYRQMFIGYFFPPVFLDELTIDVTLGAISGSIGALAAYYIRRSKARSEISLMTVMAEISVENENTSIAKAITNLIDDHSLVGVALWRTYATSGPPDTIWSALDHFTGQETHFRPEQLVSADEDHAQEARKEQGIKYLYNEPLMQVAGRKHGQIVLAFSNNQNRLLSPPLRNRLQRASISALTALELSLRTQELVSERERNVAEREKKNLAAEIHETTVQKTYAVSLHVEEVNALLRSGDENSAKKRLETARTLASESYEQARAIMNALAHITQDTQDLQTQLDDTVAELTSQARGREPTMTISGISPTETPKETENLNEDEAHAMTMIAREAMRNTIKHAPNATKISYTLTYDVGHLYLKVIDDGGGFDAKKITAGPTEYGGYGMEIMREKAEMIGAKLDIDPTFNGTGDSRGSTGTCIKVSLPVDPAGSSRE